MAIKNTKLNLLGFILLNLAYFAGQVVAIVDQEDPYRIVGSPYFNFFHENINQIELVQKDKESYENYQKRIQATQTNILKSLE